MSKKNTTRHPIKIAREKNSRPEASRHHAKVLTLSPEESCALLQKLLGALTAAQDLDKPHDPAIMNVGLGALGALGATLPPPLSSKGPIQDQLDALERALNELDSTAQRMSDKLDPVLSCEPPETASNGMGDKSIAPGSSSLHGQLQRSTMHTHWLISRITRLIDRLELPEPQPGLKGIACDAKQAGR